ncbi:hypothetical protein LCGC14_2217950, partial [marine sediment metagenome]
SVIVPIDAHRPLIEGKIVRLKNKLDNKLVSFQLERSMTKLFGEDFNTETLFKLFNDIFKQQFTSSKDINYYITKFLDTLNGELIAGTFFRPGPTYQQINNIIKVLFMVKVNVVLVLRKDKLLMDDGGFIKILKCVLHMKLHMLSG